MEINSPVTYNSTPGIAERVNVPERSVKAQVLKEVASKASRLLGGQEEPKPNGVVGEAIRTGDISSVLSTREKQVINALFASDGEQQFKLYGPEQAKPPMMGNFIDLRG